MIGTRIFPLLLLMLYFVSFLPGKTEAQSLSSASANFRETTAYPTFPINDPIWYFCTQESVPAGSLTAQSAGTAVSFVWEKFDPVTITFRNFANETGTTSTKNQLADGCYRVSFTENGKNSQFRAWIMNGWSRPLAAIALSTCTQLKLSATVSGANYQYYDLTTGKPVPIDAGYRFRWYSGTNNISSLQNPTISNPPSKNTLYRIEVTDRGRLPLQSRAQLCFSDSRS